MRQQQSPTNHPLSSRSLTRIGLIAAVYAALTVLTLTLLSGLAWGPVQFRLSEAICVLALFTPEAIPGLALGCVLANLVGIALTGSGPLGLLDVVFGSLASALGAFWMWRWRRRWALALLGPVLANAAIVAAYLPILLVALGFYTIPFTTISLTGSWFWMYVFGFISIALGEAIVIYGLGWPLAHLLVRSGLAQKLSGDNPPKSN
ncbi:MAG: QueT transporter family protein [Actinomycetia bacterium]|nr:QueT transporter family protein [Actinomycetes bacterium]